MMILGSIFQCLDPILTVAACLSSKPLFLSPMDKREEATKYVPAYWYKSSLLIRNRARARFATGNSDLLTDAKAYEEVMRLRSNGQPQSSLRTFCDTVRILVFHPYSVVALMGPVQRSIPHGRTLSPHPPCETSPR